MTSSAGGNAFAYGTSNSRSRPARQIGLCMKMSPISPPGAYITMTMKSTPT
jgi:hypothetical protein